MTTMISRPGGTPDDDFTAWVANAPIYDHCPTWCCEYDGERVRGLPDDEHGDVHETSSYAPAGFHGVYAALQRPDIHGMEAGTPVPGVGDSTF